MQTAGLESHHPPTTHPDSGRGPMLRVLGRPRRFCDGVTRREAMTVGALSTLGAGINLPHYVALPTYLGWGFALKRPGPWAGFLGKRFDPLCAEAKPVIDPKPAAGRRPMWLGTPTLADATLGLDMTLDRLDSRKTL